MKPSLQFVQYEPTFKKGVQKRLETDLLSTSEDLRAAKLKHYRKNGGNTPKQTSSDGAASSMKQRRSGNPLVDTTRMGPAAVDLVQEDKAAAMKPEDTDIV